ncbi:hypothetical protein TVAG_121290 [Trichomonas vaginalis G3]|uniref:Uncharacterized protein n=1 Tax=Trichomonas vaginalis (strain ATCC PRA-98 / G3) TaxID=412133 RepID=A2G0D6_TRIV3|nr:hypothetical protein TVAGG3_1008640 [Trichomonas vaginalis G3]EAX89385.1 hypothetical protein TVAG_121290 [Trichomonas vaginalis G3]KAI5491315.1 hypothetical protein TVAGG3_1008640 [Trichomonas vaginalis G3]|eukprot:XP_001302315.1 hypothetical protein [Trichomonas vaginalis G3]
MVSHLLSSFVPSLVMTLDNNRFATFATNSLKIKSLCVKRNNFEGQVKNYFNKCLKTVSLHSTEETVLSVDRFCSLVCFIGVNSAFSAVDSILGHRFSHSSFDGVFVSTKFTNDRIFIPLVFENKKIQKKDIQNEIDFLVSKQVPVVLVCGCINDCFEYEGIDKLNILSFICPVKESKKILREFVCKEINCFEECDEQISEVLETVENVKGTDAIKSAKEVLSLIGTKKAFNNSEISSILKFIN